MLLSRTLKSVFVLIKLLIFKVYKSVNILIWICTTITYHQKGASKCFLVLPVLMTMAVCQKGHLQLHTHTYGDTGFNRWKYP